MTASQLETALFNILDQDVQRKRAFRCEGSYGSDATGQDDKECGAPDAKFYEWKEGSVDFEAYLCDPCARKKGL